MKKLPLKPVLFLLLVAGQLAALGAMIHQQRRILDRGVAVRLECEPVDPRSLLSGDYVILNYKISRFERAEIDELLRGERDFRRGRPVWVALEKNETTGFHEAAALAADRASLHGHGIVMRGRLRRSWGDDLDLRYGIEQYFVPQGQGLEIERSLRETSVEVAVDAKGRSAVKRLFISGVAVEFR